MGYRSNICLKNDDDNGVRWLRRFDDNSSSYSLDNYYHRYNFHQRKERRSLKIIHRALTTIGPLSFTCIFFVSVLFLSSIVKGTIKLFAFENEIIITVSLTLIYFYS